MQPPSHPSGPVNTDFAGALTQFGDQPAVLVMVGVERDAPVPISNPEIGDWMVALWEAVKTRFPSVVTTRPGWRIISFAVAGEDVDRMTEGLREALLTNHNPALESFCVVGVAEGNTEQKLRYFDDLIGEVNIGYYNFGRLPGPLNRMVDGVDWKAPGE